MVGQLARGRIAARRGGGASSTTFKRNRRSSRNWPAAAAVFEVVVGCRDQPDVGRASPGFTDAFVAAFLDESQQFRLEREGNVTDFVEEQAASFGGLDVPSFSNSPGE